MMKHLTFLAIVALIGGSMADNSGCDELDGDGDGYTVNDGDCDDTNGDVYPGAEEVCNGIDDNCDGEVDEGFVSGTFYYDQDGDGYGDPYISREGCDLGDLWAEVGGDCDDNDAQVNPGAEEVCNEIDDNCDGEVDEGLMSVTFYYDLDGDGYGTPNISREGCDLEDLWVEVGGDCDDSDAQVNPGAEEVCNEIDDNCDGQVDEGLPTGTFFYDQDGDGYGDSGITMEGCDLGSDWTDVGGDCDDSDYYVNPGREEACDELDNNCDGEVDEGLPTGTFYYDQDGDGYGDSDITMEGCDLGNDWADVGGDCDDSDRYVNPGREEVCDEIDNNCDGEVDEGFVTGTFYYDQDGDGYGADDNPTNGCDAEAPFSEVPGDCDDAARDVNPDQVEQCDGIDNDCNGVVDDDPVYSTWYVDSDWDGYGSTTETVVDCVRPTGYAPQEGDCDNTQSTIHPGAPELCDGLDNDCDGRVDFDPLEGFFRDLDGDGFGDPNDVVCLETQGYLPVRGDCDDGDLNVHPGAVDDLGDGVDQDCGGSDGPQPHVGLSTDSMDSVAAALEAGASGDVIWVGAGTYVERSLSFGGKDLALRSTHFAAQTILDADRDGRVMVFESGESRAALLDGFTVSHGRLTAPVEGAGLRIVDSSPTIRSCILYHNLVYSMDGHDFDKSNGVRGGAVYVERGEPLFQGVQFLSNTAQDYEDGLTSCQGGDCIIYVWYDNAYGGGLYALGSGIALQSCVFEYNAATEGGGLYANRSEIHLQNVQFSQNTALSKDTNSESLFWLKGKGGALRLVDTVMDAVDLSLSQNEALLGAGVSGERMRGQWRSGRVEEGTADLSGGGLLLEDSSCTLLNITVANNTATQEVGGGILIDGGTPTLHNLLITGNQAPSNAGMVLQDTSAQLTHMTLVDNRATGDYEGNNGLYVDDGSFESRIENSILANNGGHSIWVDNTSIEPPQALITDSLIFESLRVAHNLTNLDSSNAELDPQLLGYHLQPDSPARDVGPNGELDGDDSPSDLGMYGGPWGDMSYYQDGDGDDLFDGWETEYGLNLASDDSQTDPDGDGLVNLAEQKNDTDPTQADTDGDGMDDGQELANDLDPLDPVQYENGVPVYRLPEDFSTLNEALSVVAPGTILDLTSATYSASYEITFDVALRGRDASLPPTLDEGLSARGCSLELSDLTVSGGHREDGGGLSFQDVDARLNNVDVLDNVADVDGGGIYAQGGSLRIVGGQISGNQAAGPYWCNVGAMDPDMEICGSEGAGGGIFLDAVDASLEGVAIEANALDADGDGGGLYARNGTLSMKRSRVRGNDTGYLAADYTGGITFGRGGGIFLTSTVADIEDGLFSENSSGSGGGIFFSGSELTLRRIWVENNLSTGGCAEDDYGHYVCSRDDIYGAGIYAATNVLTVNGLALMGNTIEDPEGTADDTKGGAAYFYGTTVVLEGIVAIENVQSVAADVKVPGVYISGGDSTQLSMSNSAFYGDGGMLLYLDEAIPSDQVSLGYSALYNTDGSATHNLVTLPSTFIETDPGFLSVGSGVAIDPHLSLESPLIDAGSADDSDVDGSPRDIGLYGGSQGDLWDTDDDGAPAYFWPGTLEDAPSGFDPAQFDADDRDAAVQ